MMSVTSLRATSTFSAPANLAEWLDWHLSSWRQGFETLQKSAAGVGASCQSSWSVAVELKQSLTNACLCVLCVLGMTDALDGSHGATNVSPFDSCMPIWNLCPRFWATWVGPSHFSLQDRHLIPTLHCTFAMCTAWQVTTIAPMPRIKLCPSSLSCSCVECSSVDDLKRQVPRLWSCPPATNGVLHLRYKGSLETSLASPLGGLEG